MGHTIVDEICIFFFLTVRTVANLLFQKRSIDRLYEDEAAVKM